jgi:hypothetical protein
MLSVLLVFAATFCAASSAQADLVSLAVVLSAVWTSGVVVNETLITDNNGAEQQTARSTFDDPQLVSVQNQLD